MCSINNIYYGGESTRLNKNDKIRSKKKNQNNKKKRKKLTDKKKLIYRKNVYCIFYLRASVDIKRQFRILLGILRPATPCSVPA